MFTPLAFLLMGRATQVYGEWIHPVQVYAFAVNNCIISQPVCGLFKNPTFIHYKKQVILFGSIDAPRWFAPFFHLPKEYDSYLLSGKSDLFTYLSLHSYLLVNGTIQESGE